MWPTCAVGLTSKQTNKAVVYWLCFSPAILHSLKTSWLNNRQAKWNVGDVAIENKATLCSLALLVFPK